MKLYAGIDLHSNNNYLGISDAKDQRVHKKRLVNNPDVVLEELEPFRKALVGIVVESTYNWYWLVDLLMENDYRVHLANPAGIQQYKGLKYSDDKHDAFWLAHLLRLGILKEGYIYPKEERPVRDLLRKRGHLVRLRTSLINSLQNIIERNYCRRLNVNKIKAIREDHVSGLFRGSDELELCGTVSKESIDFLGEQIRTMEHAVLQSVKLRDEFQGLLQLPGVGKILGLTIMLETGTVKRFSKVGDFASYCRKVPSKRISNKKKKGKGNDKNGNRYLAWAFSEAAELSRRYDESARRFFDRKAARSNRMVAHRALAHKLSRAAYFIMRDQVDYNPHKLFT